MRPPMMRPMFPRFPRRMSALLFVASAGCALAATEVAEVSEVDTGWSAHMTSPPVLVTAGSRQYLAYYDASRRLTLASRDTDQQRWKLTHFPVVTRWATGAHAMIGFAVDAGGILHLVPYRRDLAEAPDEPPAVIYFRSARPHDPDSMERTHLVSPSEPAPHYPSFLKSPGGDLYLECRIGVSGDGDKVIYEYDPGTRSWRRLVKLLDGEGRMSAYGSPRLGPDGRWHCHWMWRDTSDAASNHTLCYMVSDDLREWRNAAGESIELPVKPGESRVVVDPAPAGGGLINPSQHLSFDSRNRPVISYHRYNSEGNSAFYNARFENGSWKRVAAWEWDFRWDFGGGGAVDMEVRGGPVERLADGRLMQQLWSQRDGRRNLVLDEAGLAFIREAQPAKEGGEWNADAWRRAHSRPEIDFPERPLTVTWLADRGMSPEPGTRYLVRWEHGPVNVGDRPVPEPWSPPAPLRVFKVRD